MQEMTKFETAATTEATAKMPPRTGRAVERPTRLGDGDLVEAISDAVLRELQGGLRGLDTDFPTTTGLWLV